MVDILTLFCAGVLVAGDPGAKATPPPPAPALWTEYEARKARSGKGAAAEVELALWCEDHGLTAERRKHLTRAVLLEPNHVLGRGLLGFVEHQGRWLRPERVGPALQSDERVAAALAEYNARRDKLDQQTAAAQAGSEEPAANAKLAELKART